MIRLFFIVLVLQMQIAHAQIQVYVKKGDVNISNLKYRAGSVITLKQNDIVTTGAASRVIVKKKSQILELPINTKFNYNQLLNKLNKQQSFSSAFLSVATNNQGTKKSNAGATVRGETSDPLAFFPTDSALICSDSLELKILTLPAELLTEVKLYREGSADTMFLNQQQYTHWIKNLMPGLYRWEYKARLGDRNFLFQNIFIVPDKNKLQLILEEIQAYKTELFAFSQEMQDILLNEYLISKRWVL